jgi:lysyl-tRNA synthetase, class II
VRRAFGLLVAAAGVVNIVSAASPPIATRLRWVEEWLPFTATRAANVIVVQAGLLLLVVGRQLARGKRRAWLVAVVLLSVSGVLHIAKGLDVEEALVSFALAIALISVRDRFRAASDPPSLLRLARIGPPLALVPFAYGVIALRLRSNRIVGGWPGWGTASSEVGKRLLWMRGPLRYSERFGEWFPVSISVMGAVILAYLLFLAFRSVVVHPAQRKPDEEAALRRLVAADRDSLAYFALRDDKLAYLDRERRSALCYTVVGGVALVSGDPLGPPERWRALVDGFLARADERGWVVAVIAAGADAVPLWEGSGFTALCMGDEAVIDPGSFSLEGRAIRKVRQAVANAERAGYGVEWHRVRTLNPDLRGALLHISEGWRGGDAERGFSMTLGRQLDPRDADCLVAVARDGTGTARGFLQFVPAGRDGFSLDCMRRDRDAPSSLNDLLIVRTIEHLRDGGARRISLNFAFMRDALAASGRLSPARRLERRLALWLGPWFQIESLYRFNNKFQPRWEPRYLAFEARLNAPSVALAALRAERLLDLRLLRRGRGGKRARRAAGATRRFG